MKVSIPHEMLLYLVENLGPCPDDPVKKVYWKNAHKWYVQQDAEAGAGVVPTPGTWGKPKTQEMAEAIKAGGLKPHKKINVEELIKPPAKGAHAPDWLLLTIIAEGDQVVPAIKLLRTLTQCSLKDAKDAIDNKQVVPCPQVAVVLHAAEISALETKGAMFVTSPCPVDKVPVTPAPSDLQDEAKVS